MIPSLPRFRIAEVVREETRVTLRGTVSRTTHGRETWVKDGRVCELMQGSSLMSGRFRRDGDEWEVVLEHPEDLGDLDGIAELDILDGYWAERAELVFDPHLTWTRACWTEELRHDHCGICWAMIHPSDHREYYLASDGRVVCVPCHQDYVSRRSLGFIPEHDKQSPGFIPKHGGTHMRMEQWIRAIAGLFILLSLGLAHVHHPNWLYFTAFVGFNLLQSAFTKWCLMEDILSKLGIEK